MQIEIQQKPKLVNKSGIKIYLAEINSLLAEIHYNLNDVDQAIAYIDSALEIIEVSDYYNAKAKFLLDQGQFAKALDPLQELTQRGYADSMTYFLLGYAFSLNKDYPRGLWFYKQAVKKGKVVHIDLYIADNYYQSGAASEADKYVEKYFRTQPVRETLNFIENYQAPDNFNLSLKNSEKIIKSLKNKSEFSTDEMN